MYTFLIKIRVRSAVGHIFDMAVCVFVDFLVLFATVFSTLACQYLIRKFVFCFPDVQMQIIHNEKEWFLLSRCLNVYIWCGKCVFVAFPMSKCYFIKKTIVFCFVKIKMTIFQQENVWFLLSQGQHVNISYGKCMFFVFSISK